MENFSAGNFELSGIHIQRRQRMIGTTGFGFDGQITWRI